MGSEAFRTSHLRIQLLSVAMEQALISLRELWGERRLVDDLLPLVLVEMDTLTSDPDVVQQIEASLMDATTGLFDTHPASLERLSRVLQFGSTVQIEDSRPASDLFRDFGVLSASLTLDFYRQHIDGEVDERNLLPMAEVLARREEREGMLGALERFFMNAPLVDVGVFPGTQELEDIASCEETISALNRARQRMSTMMEQVTSDIECYLEAEALRSRMKFALTLLSANVKFKAKDLGLDTADWSTLEQQLEGVEQVLVDRRERLTPAMAAVWSRLEACLTLLCCRERYPLLKGLKCDTERHGELVTALSMLGGIWPKLRVLRRLVGQLSILFNEARTNRDNRAFQVSVSYVAESAFNTTHEVLQPLAEVAYPYQHLEGPVSIAGYAAPRPVERTGDAILGTSIDVVERLGFLYVRIWGELVSAAEQVEKALGLPLLPDISSTVRHGERSQSD